MAKEQFEAITQRRKKFSTQDFIDSNTDNAFSIPLTTVSMSGTFDAYISIQFDQISVTLIVDSGNTTLIIPHWEDIENLPGYTVLGTATEPWGCPANVVQGPIVIPTSTGATYTIKNCVFYACTANNSSGVRTANFGAGCIAPWSASGWNVPPCGVVMQAPLSYNQAYPYAAFAYAAAEEVFSESSGLHFCENSAIVISQILPSDYTMLSTIPNLEWMSLSPLSFGIGSTQTQWPGTVQDPIAMVDTGGGPVYLSDPNGYLYNTSWPDPVSCPVWASRSENCVCTSDQLHITLGGGEVSFSYSIDTSMMPPSVQGLTAVLCQLNAYMMGQQGMNIGGISALFNSILIDYSGAQVGFRSTALQDTPHAAGYSAGRPC
jgi:hypothetical protein